MHRRLLRLLPTLLALSLAAMAPAAHADFISTDGGNGFDVRPVADPTEVDESGDDAGDDDVHNEAEGVSGYEEALEGEDAVDDPPLAGEAVAKKKSRAKKQAKRSRAKSKSRARAKAKAKVKRRAKRR